MALPEYPATGRPLHGLLNGLAHIQSRKRKTVAIGSLLMPIATARQVLD
jgi:hypothetical protein